MIKNNLIQIKQSNNVTVITRLHHANLTGALCKDCDCGRAFIKQKVEKAKCVACECGDCFKHYNA